MSKDNELDANLKACVVFAAISFVLYFIAFVTPYWIVSYPEFHSQFVKLGLWVACFDDYEHPEDYVSKKYTGCWYVYWPEYDYIRDWLNPGWFYGVQMTGILCLICGGVAFILILVKVAKAVDVDDLRTNVLAIVFQCVAVCCYIIVLVGMGVMSKDRKWLPRPDHNHVSWSFAFAVIAGFCAIFCLFHLITHWLVYNWAPSVVSKDHVDSNIPIGEIGGGKSHISGNPSGVNVHGGTSTIYSQSGKPVSQYGVTSGATASAKVREAMTLKASQNAGSMSSLNNPMLRNRGSTHSLASMGKNGELRGSMSSLHSTSRRPRTPMGDDSVV